MSTQNHRDDSRRNKDKEIAEKNTRSDMKD